MEIPVEYEEYKKNPHDCPIYDENRPDYRCSVDFDKTNYRKNKASSEHGKDKVDIFAICKLIDCFLEKMKINSKSIILKGIDVLSVLNYEVIKQQYKLKSQSDIVWLRFTDDGYLGVVGASNDINFDNDTNSYKLIKHVGCEWDKNSILIVPIPGIKDRTERDLLEKMIGNYLTIGNNVPIIDYYSHMGFKQ